jgi:hypothetical protein
MVSGTCVDREPGCLPGPPAAEASPQFLGARRPVSHQTAPCSGSALQNPAENRLRWPGGFGRGRCSRAGGTDRSVASRGWACPTPVQPRCLGYGLMARHEDQGRGPQ